MEGAKTQANETQANGRQADARAVVPVHIRWMINSDLHELLAIETTAFGGWGLPWNEDDFRGQLRKRNGIGMVAVGETNEDILGYMVYELEGRRINLLNFVVEPGLRRRKIGSQMMAKLFSKLDVGRRDTLQAVVPELYTDMHVFLRSMGWRAVRRLPDVLERFFPTTPDGYLFAFHYTGELPDIF